MKAKNVFIGLFVVLSLVFGLVVAGCGDGADIVPFSPDPGGPGPASPGTDDSNEEGTGSPGGGSGGGGGGGSGGGGSGGSAGGGGGTEGGNTGGNTGGGTSPSSIAVSGVSLNKTSTSLTVGATETLAAVIAPSNATNKNVTWSSSNSSVATVANGVVTAVATGSATVTVTTADGSRTAACNVTVITPAFTVSNTAEWNNALSLISNGGNNQDCTITVIGDVNVPGTIVNSFGNASNLNVTINGANGSTGNLFFAEGVYFEGGYAGSILRIGNSQSITINNIILNGNWNRDNDTSLVVIQSGGSLAMTGGSIIRNNLNNGPQNVAYGGGVSNWGTFTMQDNSSVYGNGNWGNGGGVANYGGIFTMRDNAKVFGNEVNTSFSYSSSGGGVYVEDGTFIMQGSAEVHGNKEGGVLVGDDGTFIMQDNASVHNNEAVFSGGGVRISGAFTMQGSATVHSNNIVSTSGNGGGVFVNGGTFTMQDNAKVFGNETLGDYGGGVFVYSGTFTMLGSAAVHGNKAFYGGGVFIRPDSFIIMQDNASVHSNEAVLGGGVANWGGTFRISGGIIYGSSGNMSNTANTGAALHVRSDFSNTLAQYGSGNTWTNIPLDGDLRDTTIEVIDGVLQ